MARQAAVTVMACSHHLFGRRGVALGAWGAGRRLAGRKARELGISSPDPIGCNAINVAGAHCDQYVPIIEGRV